MTGVSRRLWLAGPLAMLATTGLAALSPEVRDIAKEHLRALLFHAAWRPEPTGPRSVGFTTLTLDVGGSDGRITADLWYPAEPAAPGRTGRLDRAEAAIARPTLARAWRDARPLTGEGRTPLILFQPSWFSQRRESSYMLANLASHGFIAVAADDFVHYPGARGPEAALRAVGLDYASDAAFRASVDAAAERSQAAARFASSILDAVGADATWGARVEPSRIGILGFSFGGAVAAEMARGDARVAAAVNLDGSTFGETGLLGVERPYLALFSGGAFPSTAELSSPDPVTRLDAGLTLLESERQVARVGRPDQWCFVFADATHLDFCDRLVMPPFSTLRAPRDLDRRRLWSAINAYVVTFLGQALRGDAPPLLCGAPLPGVMTVLEARALATPMAAVAG
jgi:dienelactone hydrolase